MKEQSFIPQEKYMRRAIELAKLGTGYTDPNPLVGAVIVKNDTIIGEGYHQRYGELHAERNALASLTQSPEGATLYVTLEPCCHHGKTPPCTEAILENHISRVVIGSRDPNPLVAGKGVHFLRDHGIEVIEDFLREECDAINTVFFHYITTGLPYVVMKYAMTLDGKIACKTGASKWITGEKARAHVHQLRGTYQAIMVGIGTILADDPLLNCRIEGAHQPLRILVDSSLRTPLNSQICQTASQYPTLIAFSLKNEEKEQALNHLGIETIYLPSPDGQVDLLALIKELGARHIDSVLMEGGGTLHEAALRAEIVNHVCAYIAPKIFGGKEAKSPVEGLGISSPDESVRLYHSRLTPLGDDYLLEYDVDYGNSILQLC